MSGKVCIELTLAEDILDGHKLGITCIIRLSWHKLLLNSHVEHFTSSN